VGYRAPTFSVVPQSFWALDILAELGFQYDSSIFPVRHDRYGVPGSSTLTSPVSALVLGRDFGTTQTWIRWKLTLTNFSATMHSRR
jgi:hypothetical protein